MDHPDIITDVFGATWRVTGQRQATGCTILLGRPWPPSRQGETVILTDDLAEALTASRDDPAALSVTLPISRTAIKRLRQMLGHNWRDDRALWYFDRLDDLATMTIEGFAAKHGVSSGAASTWHNRLFGPRQRPAGWWRDPQTHALILTGTDTEASAATGIPKGSIRRLRSLIKRTDDHDAT